MNDVTQKQLLNFIDSGDLNMARKILQIEQEKDRLSLLRQTFEKYVFRSSYVAPVLYSLTKDNFVFANKNSLFQLTYSPETVEYITLINKKFNNNLEKCPKEVMNNLINKYKNILGLNYSETSLDFKSPSISQELNQFSYYQIKDLNVFMPNSKKYLSSDKTVLCCKSDKDRAYILSLKI